MAHPLEAKVADYIRQHRLLDPGRPVAVGVSGGADSVALLRLLLNLGYRCTALHCDFQLRGEESRRDARFVADLCQRLDVPCIQTRFATRDVATRRGVSIEMAARDLRYDFFTSQLQQLNAQAVCVAHHRDDQVETLLLHLVRGTGLRGLTGMAPRRGDVVRPLLSCSRAELCDYLSALGQAYVTDSTNLVPDVQRNRLRLQVLPLLRELNPAVDDALLRLADHASEELALADEALEQACRRVQLERNGNGLSLSLKALADEPAARTILHRLLEPYGFTAAQMVQIIEATRTGAQFTGHTGEALVDRGRLHVRPFDDDKPSAPTPIALTETTVEIPTGNLQICLEIFRSMSQVSRRADEATLDADRLTGALTIRPVQSGDRFVPYGMTASRLVSDYLTDLKRSRFDRQRQLALCADGQIVWLLGLRTDARYAVTPATRRIARFIYTPHTDNTFTQ